MNKYAELLKRINDMIGWLDNEAAVSTDSAIDLLEDCRNALVDCKAPVVAPQLAKHQPCGCVICTCADDVQCQGCGATHCGTHPVGEFSAPVFETAPENEQLRTALTAALNWYERQAQTLGDFEMVERMKGALKI